MKVREAQKLLTEIGFGPQVGKIDGDPGPMFRNAVESFQRGWAFKRYLKVDGVVGARTAKAIRKSVRLKGKCSPNFKYREFASKGNGHIRTHRALVKGLEKARRKINRPIGILSGHRDPIHNRRVGGAASSQHVYGNACDPVHGDKLTLEDAISLRCFSGIGYKVINGRKVVRHLDVRHKGPNTTGGTPANPTIWAY